MNRKDYLQWCRDRALKYIELGDLQGSLTSMLTDLRNHPKTRDSVEFGGRLGLAILQSKHLDTPEEMTRFIKGFN